jgi:hypothetical protein
MSPEATFVAFMSALSHRAWREAVDLVHPEFARHCQARDLQLMGAYFASADAPEPSETPPAATVVVIGPGADLSRFYERRVDTFPGHPSLGELAALAPGEFLACSMAARAAREGSPPDTPRSLPKFEIVKVTEDGVEGQLEMRLPQLQVEEEADAVLRVRLRMHAGSWRIRPEADEFMAPTPWEHDKLPPSGSSPAAV